MTKVVRPAAERLQAVLDQRLALAVEARRRLVEDQNPRIGEDGAGDRHALPLPARQLDPALPDDRVVLLVEALDELVGVRDVADGADLLQRGVLAAVADVVADRAVEEEVVLQHDAELRAVVAQPHRREIAAVDPDPPAERPVERHDQADERALPGAARSHQRGRRPGGRREADVLQHRHALGCTRSSRSRTRSPHPRAAAVPACCLRRLPSAS